MKELAELGRMALALFVIFVLAVIVAVCLLVPVYVIERLFG